jgi:hypothetical protein
MKAVQKSSSLLSENHFTPPDFRLEFHGSIYLLQPLNPAATSWVDEHIGSNLIEPRYLEDVLIGIKAEGFRVLGVNNLGAC